MTDYEEAELETSGLKFCCYNWIFFGYLRGGESETMVLEGNKTVDSIIKESNPGGVPNEASVNMPSRSQAVGTSRTRLWIYFKQQAFLSNV